MGLCVPVGLGGLGGPSAEAPVFLGPLCLRRGPDTPAGLSYLWSLCSASLQAAGLHGWPMYPQTLRHQEAAGDS